MQVKSQDLCEGVIQDPESLPSRQSSTPQSPILSVFVPCNSSKGPHLCQWKGLGIALLNSHLPEKVLFNIIAIHIDTVDMKSNHKIILPSTTRGKSM